MENSGEVFAADCDTGFATFYGNNPIEKTECDYSKANQSLLDVDEVLAQNVAMIPIHPSGYFVTGSDTDVGKTYITCELIRQLALFKLNLEVRKPAESGCEASASGEMIAADGLKLQAANRRLETIDSITRFKYRAAVAPPRAAQIEGRCLLLNDLLGACARDDCNSTLIVEGAGGFYSPLAEDGLNADLACLLQLPVIIVINDKIGAVNQALLTIQAVGNSGLPIAAIIMNQAEEVKTAGMNNRQDLQAHCKLPIFGCGYNAALEPIFEVTHG
ncbi:MAG: dethiobiotin synthetase [Gammaproteobacteria bacterium]|jgi:dethiobiotin synthetase